MPTSTTYQQLAQAYAAGARALLTPAIAAAGERGGIAPVAKGPAAPLADQAEQLAPLAAEFTWVAAAQLDDPDPQARLQATTCLLVKALAELEISARLLQAAEEEEQVARPKGAVA